MNDPQTPQAGWYCVKTQAKREQIAAGHLRRIEGVEVFSPRLRYRKNTARGRIWWVEPLFPGYLMARFELQKLKALVRHCTGVRGLVQFGREVPEVPESIIEQLRLQIAAQGDAETVTSTPVIEIGDEVRIGDGPLRGMPGRIVEVAPALERVGVLLEFLGESRVLELDILSLVLPRKPLPFSTAH